MISRRGTWAHSARNSRSILDGVAWRDIIPAGHKAGLIGRGEAVCLTQRPAQYRQTSQGSRTEHAKYGLPRRGEPARQVTTDGSPECIRRICIEAVAANAHIFSSAAGGSDDNLVDARADQCRTCSTESGCQTGIDCAAIWHLPIRCAQGVGVRRQHARSALSPPGTPPELRAGATFNQEESPAGAELLQAAISPVRPL
jgi:hypothetical protein